MNKNEEKNLNDVAINYFNDSEFKENYPEIA